MTATTSLRERLLAIADEVDDLHGPGMDGGDARKLGTRIRDAVAGLSTPPAGEWMPIESAPKDGRVVLFCDRRGNRWTQVADCRTPICGYPPAYWHELPTPATGAPR